MDNLRVIYIDDDPEALELYQEILCEEFNVETCNLPKKGLELIEDQNYAAILLDINMPEINGFELYEKIRKIESHITTPVFFISSENTVENRLKAFGLGSDDFIHRSMNPEEVIARIKSRLDKAQNRPEGQSLLKPALIYGDIEIDQDRLLARCRGQLIDLTQTEMRLALLLVREAIENPQNILDRDTIIKFVWPLDHESVWPRTLSTHLTNLRKKLNSKKVKIVSKRQAGFHLSLS